MSGFSQWYLFYLVLVAFLGVLAWAGIGSTVVDRLPEPRHRRYRRVGTWLATIGIAHPMISLAGRDTLRQIQIADGVGQPVTRHADVCVGLSLLVTVALSAIAFG
jgi:hypothetical protein